jgi:hypothetical protein
MDCFCVLNSKWEMSICWKCKSLEFYFLSFTEQIDPSKGLRNSKTAFFLLVNTSERHYGNSIPDYSTTLFSFLAFTSFLNILTIKLLVSVNNIKTNL